MEKIPISKWEAIAGFLTILFIIALLTIPITFFGVMLGYFPEQYDYRYDVKTEQISDTDWVEENEVVQFENLTDDEQQVLYDAFKEQDHFFGSSEETAGEYDEPLDTFDGWKTVERGGALFVMAVEENVVPRQDWSQYQWYHKLSVYLTAFAIVLVLAVSLLGPPE